MRTPFTGVGTALITPFTRDGSLDEVAVKRLAKRQIDAGVHFLSPCGTTGEAPTLTHRDKLRVVELVLEEAKGRVPVLAGAGGYDTREVVELARDLERVGADGLLSVAPYYNKPTQEGLYQHFKAIADAVDLPMILYNVPGRTVADMSNDTVLRLAQLPRIVAIKDATGNIERGTDLVKRAPKGFSVLSGDDATCLALTLLGGQGAISVTANVAPRLMHEMIAAGIAGEVVKAREINMRLLGLHRNLFVEANPIPVKWACARMGLIEDGRRLPMTPMSPEFNEKVLTALREAGVQV